MALFGDIGKAGRDLLGGYKFEHTAAITSKVSGHAVTGNAKADGSFDVKVVSYKVHGVSAEATAASNGKSALTVTKEELIKGLKVSLNTQLAPKVSGAKATAQYTFVPPVGKTVAVKCETTLSAAPKADVSAAYVHGPYTVGAEFDYDDGKKTVGKYNIGGQYVGKEDTVTVLLADKTDTLKLSVVHKVSASLTAAAELVHKISKKDTSGSVGIATKLDGGAVSKAMLTSAGVFSILYTKDTKVDLAKGLPTSLSVTAAAQLNALKGFQQTPKYGIQATLK